MVLVATSTLIRYVGWKRYHLRSEVPNGVLDDDSHFFPTGEHLTVMSDIPSATIRLVVFPQGLGCSRLITSWNGAKRPIVFPELVTIEMNLRCGFFP